MKNIVFILFLTIFFLQNAIAQNTLSGIVSDEDNSPVFYATVVLYNQSDSTIANSSLTDDKGKFVLNNISDGEYYLEIRFLGYQNEIIENLNFPKDNETSVSIIIEPENEELEEVVVKANRILLEQKSDRLVVNIDNNIMNDNSTIMDVMRKVPGVIVMGDKISMAGSTNLTILINGKTTKYMDIESLLKDMPGDNIEKIEVIHQPGAEFDAAGSGPVINIILKKNSLFGTFGSVETGISKGDMWRYNTNCSFTHFQDDVNISGSIGYRNSDYKSQMIIDRYVVDTLYEQISVNNDSYISYRGNLSVDWNFNTKHRLGFQTSFVNYDSDDIIMNNTDIYHYDENVEDIFQITSNSRTGYWRLGTINPYYVFDIDTLGQKLELDFNYIQYGSDSENFLDAENLNSEIVVNDQRTKQPGVTKIMVGKLDYTFPFSKALKFQTGAKYSYADLDNDFHAEYLSNNLWIDDITQSNHYLFDETIIAGYGKFTYEQTKWAGTLGLRYEDSKSNGQSVGIDTILSRPISDFFPSASISYEFIKNVKAILAYSYRLDRPHYSSLNPFRYSLDLYTFEQGNPELKPEFTHSSKFSLAYQNQPFFNIEYKTTKDAMVEVSLQNDATGQAYLQDVNLDKRNEINFSLFFPLDFIPKVSGYGGVMVNNKHFDTPFLGETYDVSKWDYVTFIQANFTLPGNISTEISGYYTSGGLDGTINYEYMYGLSAACSRKFFSDRLKVNLGVNNIVTKFFYGEIKYSNMNIKMNNSWEAPVVYLNLSYSFGNKHLTKSDEHKSGASDELDRTGKN